jgi:hypothetical protein
MRLLLCSLLSTLCWAQAQTCAVEGQVFNNASGEPVKKAQLMLRGMGSSSEPPYGALSDAAGRFSIKDIRPGRYVLTAERNGFVRGEYGAQGQSRRGTVLTLSSGQVMKDVVFRLVPHGVITGRVLDEDGDVIAGVQMQVMKYGYVQGRRTLVPASMATTNDLGEYRMPGLAPGKYYVSASYRPLPVFSQSNAEDNYAPTYYPGTADPAAAAPVQVVPGNQMRGIDITLTKTRTVRVAGRVANPAAGAGSRNVMVFLMPRDGGMRGFSNRNSTVVQEGKFEIRGVIPGSYLIAAHWYEDSRRYTASQPVDVGNAGLDGISLTMSPGFEVPGQVRVDGAPDTKFRGARISLTPANDMLLAGALGGQVKADGSFVLTGVAPDQYRVQVFGMPDGCYLKSARLGENDMLENGATLTAGAGPLEIVLSAAGGQVDGVVMGNSQQPAGGATALLIPDERRRNRPDLFRTTTTDQNGRFSMKGVAPGDYKLYAFQEVEPGAWQDPEFLKRYERDAESVSVTENGRHGAQLKLLISEEQ